MCTAGRCRSPIAAALFDKHVEPSDSPVSVSSVGLRFTGDPTPATGVNLMAELDIDLADNRSAQVTKESVDAADIVFGMTREHVREIVALSPEAWPKTFTLKDFARRASRAAPRRRHQRMDDWLESLGGDRDPRDTLGNDPHDDLIDPFGQRTKVWKQLIDDLDELVRTVVSNLGLGITSPTTISGRRRSADYATNSSSQQTIRRVNVAR